MNLYYSEITHTVGIETAASSALYEYNYLLDFSFDEQETPRAYRRLFGHFQEFAYTIHRKLADINEIMKQDSLDLQELRDLLSKFRTHLRQIQIPEITEEIDAILFRPVIKDRMQDLITLKEKMLNFIHAEYHFEYYDSSGNMH